MPYTPDSVFPATPQEGVDFDRVDTVRKHPLGTIVLANNGARYIYLLAGGTALAAGDVNLFSSAYVASASGTAGPGVVVSPAAVAAASYFWGVIGGPVAAKVTTSLAAGVPILPTTDVTKLFNIASATEGARGFSLTAESGGLATVYLF